MTEHARRTTRRAFLEVGAAGAAVATATGVAAQDDAPARPPFHAPSAVEIPTMKADTEAKAGPPFAPLEPGARLGFAIVGLGELALGEILPAFGACRYAKPTALVSGDRAKAEKVASQYGLGSEHLYDYRTFDRIADNPMVDVVYIVLPNSMHEEFVSRATKAGKHVLCEKPMGNTSAECERMIDACKQARRLLMIAYRCQYQPLHRELIRMARSGTYGPVRTIEAVNGQNQGPAEQWRHRKAHAGGGSLPDVGIYCLNAARYVTGEEPIRVAAQIRSDPSDPRFKEVEDRVAFQLEFPSGVLASCQTYYSGHEARRLRVIAERGWIDLDPAFSYKGLRMKTSEAAGKAERTTEIALPETNQFALEMDHMAERVAKGERPHTPGEEGLQDVRLIEALYESAREGRAVDLPPAPRIDSTRGPGPADA